MPQQISRVPLADQVFQLLQERILERHYKPGDRLNIDALARELNVSTSPIREALTRLSGQALVTFSSFQGFSVEPLPTRGWFEQLLTYRILNEGWAARQAARLRSASSIAAMQRSLKDLQHCDYGGQRARDYAAANKADQDFHDAMLDAAGNDILAHAVRSLHPHLHHARLFSDVRQETATVLAEHHAILKAIQAGDEDGAAGALEAHLRASWKRYDSWSPAPEVAPEQPGPSRRRRRNPC